MNSSNNFNVCPRCGNPNALSAKFCARCGQQLKVPQEAVICHKCGARNTPLANFCRSCGTTLKVGLQTKICPKCGKEVDVTQSTCDCGYGFANLATVTPAPAEETTQVGVADEVTETVEPARTHGRAFAIVATVLLAIFTYFIAASAILRPDFLINFDGGMVKYRDAGALYAVDFILLFISAVSRGGGFGNVIANMGGFGSFAEFVMACMVLIAIIAHTVVCIVRICTQKRSKRPNYLYLGLASVCTLICGLLLMGQYMANPESNKVWHLIANTFVTGGTLGYVTYLIPFYFWFFFFYSLVARKKDTSEQNEEQAAE